MLAIINARKGNILKYYIVERNMKKIILQKYYQLMNIWNILEIDKWKKIQKYHYITYMYMIL